MSTQATQAAEIAINSNGNTAKKILVLGATSGIAEATCRIWAAEGAQLFLVARNANKLAAVAADLKPSPISTIRTSIPSYWPMR
jgi:NADP-dependent 3-hydroxy acid dehydrogenase YdfG